MTAIWCGLFMLVMAFITMAAQPLDTAIAYRRAARDQVVVVLRAAFPKPGQQPDLLELAQMAERALERDRITRGVQGVRRVYQLAGRGSYP